jgi:uncharacterized membrane protein (UPF0127 family)
MPKYVLHSILLTGIIVFFSFYKLSGCFNKAQRLPTVPMQIGEKQFNLEIANTQGKRQTGLMRRDSMPADHGMIFVFRNEDLHSFYMKNTRIPLDIIFVDAGGTIRSIQQMKPYALKSVGPPVPVKYAIELNEGAAAKAGAKVGDRLTIPKEAADTKE